MSAGYRSLSKGIVRDISELDRAMAAAMWEKKEEAGAFAAPCDFGASRRESVGGCPPPLLTGGERVPKLPDGLVGPVGSLKIEPTLVERLVITATGRVKHTLRRHGLDGQAAFVDWLNFTVDEMAFEWDQNSCDLSEEKMLIDASIRLQGIFGFGVTKQYPAGRNFYERSWALGNDWGFIGHGGNRATTMISLNGEGLAAAREGWERRLYDWLYAVRKSGKRVSLTRVDVARDLFDGEFSVDKCKELYECGGAGTDGRMPVCEQRGDWFRPNGSGRTFYIGRRSSGKYLRCYEKGKQLGDHDSEWTRVEVEFKSVDRVLPLELLLEPGKYLAGAYPMLEWISGVCERIATVKKSLESSYIGVCVWAKRQVGGLLKVCREIEGGVEQAFDLLVREKAPFPARFLHLMPWLSDSPQPIHEEDRSQRQRVLFEQSLQAL